MTSRDWLSVEQAASRLDVTFHQALEMVLNGPLYGRLDHDHYLVSRESVDTYLASQAEPRLNRDPSNPAERLMTPQDEHGYDEERTK